MVGEGHWALEIEGDPCKIGIEEDMYLDGSGSGADPRTRRCGWGVAWLERSEGGSKFCGGMFGNLGQEKHTLPRLSLRPSFKS